MILHYMFCSSLYNYRTHSLYETHTRLVIRWKAKAEQQLVITKICFEINIIDCLI